MLNILKSKQNIYIAVKVSEQAKGKMSEKLRNQVIEKVAEPAKNIWYRRILYCSI